MGLSCTNLTRLVVRFGADYFIDACYYAAKRKQGVDLLVFFWVAALVMRVGVEQGWESC